ncbi:hypothetical protein SAMN06295997_13230 [Malaciobacter marinus]|nr:hypothetical protein SAMN06295997_13230 [Malaciobacter marinus]
MPLIMLNSINLKIKKELIYNELRTNRNYIYG